MQVAIPVVPTIKVLVTFTKFEELQPVDEFATPPSSPTAAGRESPSVTQSTSSSWFQWIKAPYRPSSSTNHQLETKAKYLFCLFFFFALPLSSLCLFFSSFL
ncbi:hypothetical protein Patl1_18334 [Pistacia atlantica]|uniref:Uncharacterized protein n=1 Tax=Pistacia atlantica TaxID=434234 RepID=A0ACC1BZ71_9ROSI|nr:hypothetical protein Patl1_18334 [Pistacia atlantica]